MEQCYGCKSLAERIEQTERALDAERERVKELEKRLAEEHPGLDEACEQLATLQAQLAEIEQILCIESGKTTVDKVRDLHQSFKQVWNSYQSAVNELFDTQAQLRQVEGERDHAKKMEAVQKEVADNQTWHVQKLKDWRDTVTLALQRPGGARFEDVPEHIKGLVRERDALSIWVNALRDSYDDLESRHADMLGDLTTLRQLVAALPVVDVQEVSVWLSPDESGWFVSKRPAFPAGLYWAKFRTQAEADSFRALLAYRATLAAQDAKPRKCPTCDSPSPHLHPAVQYEGEVQVCSNRWHKAAQDAGKEAQP